MRIPDPLQSNVVELKRLRHTQASQVFWGRRHRGFWDAATAGSEPWESTTQSVVGVPRGSSQESLIHFRGTLLSFKGCDTRKLAKSSGDPATAGFGDAATAASEPWESPAIEATP